MVGQVATYRPGDKITVSYRRDGREITTPITLRNSTGTTDVVKTSIVDKLNADLQTLSKEQAKELGVKGGVVVKSFGDNSAFSRTRMQEGFVILKVDGKDVLSVADFRKALDSANNSVKLEGIYPGYNEGIFVVPLKLSDLR